jgi:putative tricarboxylic transport membrane protein
VRRRDLGAAAVLLTFGLLALTQARGLRFGSVVSPGPGFVPLCLAAAFSVVSLGLVVTALRTPAGAASRPPGADVAGRLKVIGTLAGLLVYALVLEPLGFLLATFALLLFFFTALQRQRWLVALGGSLATALLTHLVFKVWLGVNLPVGLWSF